MVFNCFYSQFDTYIYEIHILVFFYLHFSFDLDTDDRSQARG